MPEELKCLKWDWKLNMGATMTSRMLVYCNNAVTMRLRQMKWKAQRSERNSGVPCTQSQVREKKWEREMQRECNAVIDDHDRRRYQ